MNYYLALLLQDVSRCICDLVGLFPGDVDSSSSLTGNAAALRLQQISLPEDKADRVCGQDDGHEDRRPDGDDPGGGVQAASGHGVRRRLRGLPGRALRSRLWRGHQRRGRRRGLDRQPGQTPLRRDLLHADARQREDHRRERQEGDDEFSAPQHRAGEDLEAGRLQPGRHAGRRRVRSRSAPHQDQTGGLRAAQRAARPPRATVPPQKPHRRRPVQPHRGLVCTGCRARRQTD